MKKLFKGLGLGLATSALVLGMGAVQAFAAVTVAATAVSTDGALTVTGGTTLTLASTTSSALSLDSGTTGAINLGTGANAKTITIGNVTGATGVAINVGTGNYAVNGVGASTYSFGASTTTGTTTIGGTAQTGTITLGSSSGTNIVAIGAGAGNTTVNIAGGAGTNAVNIGTSTTTTTIAGAVTYTGTVTNSANVIKSINAALTALAGGAQAGTALNKDLNVVTTVATTGDSVQLPVAVAGKTVIVVNRATNSLNIFGQTGDGINALGANTAYALATLKRADCLAVGASGATVWECDTIGR